MNSYIDIEQLEKAVNITNVYLRDELLLINDLKESFNKLSSLYKSENSLKFEDIILQINNSISTVSINSINNNGVIKKTAEKYTWLKQKITESENSATQIIKRTDVNLK